MNKEDNEKVLDLICMAIDETNELRKRIKEAIEYIKEKQIQNEYTDRFGFRVKENKWWLEDSDILLEILEDKEVEDE